MFRVHYIYEAKEEGPKKKYNDTGKATKSMSRTRTLILEPEGHETEELHWKLRESDGPQGSQKRFYL